MPGNPSEFRCRRPYCGRQIRVSRRRGLHRGEAQIPHFASFVLRQLDDGVEITGEPGRGSVRLRGPDWPQDDVVFDFQCEVADSGVNAATWVRTLDGDGVVDWVASLAESFHGWDGVRTWESLERDLRIDATHDGRGHVSLRFVIRGPRGYEPGAWEASVVVTLDAGEDMRRLVAELTELVS